jgi:hypothetical protein
MPTDSFTDALERLDPASRALLDLSLRRGMRTEEIAEVLGADPDSVADTRDEALRRVASDVGMAGDEQLDEVRARLAELPADQWLGQATANGSAEGIETIDTEVAATEPEEKPAQEPKRRRRRWPLLVGLLVAAGAIVAIALAGGGSDDKKSSSTPAPSQPDHAKPLGSPSTKLAPIGSGATGTARLTGKRLQLDVTGLPAPHGGFYEVWLYNSVIDARSIGKSPSRHVKLDAKLPADWKHYRFVDISREPNDGNVSHSGESVARVPAAQLAR